MPSSSPDVYIEEHNVVIAPGGLAARAWPVNWSAIWVGALASLAVALIFGLIGTAIGAHQVGTSRKCARFLSFLNWFLRHGAKLTPGC